MESPASELETRRARNVEPVFREKMQRKCVNILSLDGGGVKGIIEARLLDLVMKTTTVMLTNPSDIRQLICDEGDEGEHDKMNREERQELLKILDKVTNPIHPVSLFDMIVGTSTGGLMAFALAGVRKESLASAPPDAPAIVPMTVAQVIDMYRTVSRVIFSQKAFDWRDLDEMALSYAAPSLMKFYSQTPLRRQLEKYFGALTLNDVDVNCFVGCVAKRLASVGGGREASVLFGNLTVEHSEVKVVDALLATTDAPIYFECPVVIEGKSYVDGGVGANCPIAQALRASTEVFGDGLDLVVLSLAPPSNKPENIERDGTKQVVQWLNYFPSNMTHGETIFEDCRRFVTGSPGVHHVRRIDAETDALRKHKMDRVNEVGLMFDETNDYFVNGLLGDDEDGALLVISNAITQLVPYFRNHEKRETVGEQLRGQNVCGNDEIYASLVPLTYAVAARFVSLLDDVKSAMETLEAGIQIFEMFEAEKDDLYRERNHLLEGRMYRTLGTMYRDIGRLCEARLCHRRALALIGTHRGHNREKELVACYLELGETCLYLGGKGDEDSEAYFRRAKFLVKNNEALRKRISLKLADCCRLDGRFEEALALLEEAEKDCGLDETDDALAVKIKIGMKKKVGEIKLKEARAVKGLSPPRGLEGKGLLQFFEGKFAQSLQCFQEELRIKKDAPFFEIARLCNLVGMVCLKLGDHPKALVVFRRAIDRMDRADGRVDGVVAFSSPITAASWNGVGICFLKRGEPTTAAKHFEKSLKILRSLHGEEDRHPDVKRVVENLEMARSQIAATPLDAESDEKPNLSPVEKTDEKSEAQIDKKSEATTDKKSEVKPDKKAEPQIDKKSDKKPEAKTDKKSEAKTDKKSEAKTDKKSEAKTDKKSEAKTDKTRSSSVKVVEPEPFALYH